MTLDIPVKILEVLFFGGMAGAAIVVILSFVEDLELLLKDSSSR